MPKRNDIKSILLIGSGPIVIGQACEFDYSGTQACKALREEGYKVILVNSNPATIMTDPELADTTYIEPLNVETLTEIIRVEQPDAVLPTLGGQTALNLAMELDKEGVLTKYNVELLGATAEVIEKAEDRDLFKQAMEKIGVAMPKSGIARNLDEAKSVALEMGFPCVVRPAFTLGGKGGGIAYDMDELELIASGGLESSMINEVLVEQSIIGWKEFELEMMRDKADNVLVICSIENLDPMGVHTGDSITVAPAQTLTDKEYQIMRDAAKDIIREIGVDTGGSNIQFALNPENGDMIVIEMNPRVSRSSALASKATGFPIAKLAAKLAVGYTLDELKNDITRDTPASFEPVLDYVVVKIPRFNFDKFPSSSGKLGVSMQSVGEVMSIGRTFKEALQKGMRSLDKIKETWSAQPWEDSDAALEDCIKNPTPRRLLAVHQAFAKGWSIDKIHELSLIDPWFLAQIQDYIQSVQQLEKTPDAIRYAKSIGVSDHYLAKNLDFADENAVRKYRIEHGIIPIYKMVDTCAAEFEAYTPYYYSSYDLEDEVRDSDREKIMIIGSGPNRIGQGIEFDYCCVHAAMACSDAGYESIMVNCNPETVSTDFDTSDRLYFEPLTFEEIMNIYEREKPKGVIVQFGGQTPLNIADALVEAGATILGSSQDVIKKSEDREEFQQLMQSLSIRQPKNGIAYKVEEAVNIAKEIGFPVILRPSYVLGGSAMEVLYGEDEYPDYVKKLEHLSAEPPILIDAFLESATEIDVDAVCDGKTVEIAGMMQHIEEAGVHSGDSAAVLPPFSLSDAVIKGLEESSKSIALALNVKGLLNIQFAVKDDVIYVIEVNPRASRSIPFVSKATGVPWVKIATRVILGETLADLDTPHYEIPYMSVKESVFPFNKFPDSDTVLGPDMRSTGEVMGLGVDMGTAFAKAQAAVGQALPRSGTVFISLKDSDKNDMIDVAKGFHEAGFAILATEGTAKFFASHEIPCETVQKVSEGSPHIVDRLKEKSVDLIINTPSGKTPLQDEMVIRQQAYQLGIAVVTTVAAARASVDAIRKGEAAPSVRSIQSYHRCCAGHETV